MPDDFFQDTSTTVSCFGIVCQSVCFALQAYYWVGLPWLLFFLGILHSSLVTLYPVSSARDVISNNRVSPSSSGCNQIHGEVNVDLLDPPDQQLEWSFSYLAFWFLLVYGSRVKNKSVFMT